MDPEFCIPLGFADFCFSYGVGEYLLARESFTFFGLVLNIVAVGILLLWGLPLEPMYSRGGGSQGSFLPDPRSENQQKQAWNRRVRIARACLLLIALGFALQAFGLFLL
jgi:hypothetical protein